MSVITLLDRDEVAAVINPTRMINGRQEELIVAAQREAERRMNANDGPF
ncbi:MAG: hypothetical protein HQM16_11995 [Deltaproteobacteria bacterium]|nr:hypothetical protein [Deltaproteobacteria bacterium]